MTNVVKEVKHLINFHRELFKSFADRLFTLNSIEVTEPTDSALPSVTVIQSERKPMLWYTTTGIKQTFSHTLTDKQGETHELSIKIENQLSNEDYHAVLSQILTIHQAGINSQMNFHLQLPASVLEQVITADSMVIIASIDEEPVAFALLNQVPNKTEETWEILIEVSPNKRNLGIATALFFAILEHPDLLPEHIEAEIESMNHPVLRLLQKARDEGYISFTLTIQGPSTQAHIELLQTEWES